MSNLWHTTNLVIWTIGLALQAALAVSVFLKRIPRSYPAFTVLILYYPARAILLFLLRSRMDAEAYGAWSDGLSVLALLLEAWVVLELILRVAPKGRWTGRRSVVPAALAAAALSCSWATLALAPAGLIVDRAQVLAWWVFLALLAAVVVQPTQARNLIRICAGFAAFSFLQLVALAGRAHAFLVRGGHAYVAWSYVPAGAYMAVVAYWLLFLRGDAAPEPSASGYPAVHGPAM